MLVARYCEPVQRAGSSYELHQTLIILDQVLGHNLGFWCESADGRLTRQNGRHKGAEEQEHDSEEDLCRVVVGRLGLVADIVVQRADHQAEQHVGDYARRGQHLQHTAACSAKFGEARATCYVLGVA